ncbi:very short patch repair endonuclease [Bradyrhizobium sp.]|jgi:DNA mismatch endonuclease (patch repair protein)|uniref:very short patch repair endonuclease n=1 Tax=Bradyrhizobium sp. TaxID=376 RepID=UPI002DDCFAB8|nr:very short patch repair endonuclease [Bradyrhizobium sp.]HEV2155805.1 very short patch repair endonuclease [Bradyrhizobium sp.]
MADVVSPEVRSRMMAGIRGAHTNPEMLLRRGLFAKGFRYRLHAKGLPGKPDMVFPRYNAVLFAHGCFWHGHDCNLFKIPSTRPEFWKAKIARNREVDARNEAALREAGWRCGVVWECALKGRTRLSYPAVVSQCSSWLRSRKDCLEIRGA